MKSLLAIILFFYFPVQLRAQVQVDSMSPGYNPFLADSLRSRIDRADNDTTKAWNMILLYWFSQIVQWLLRNKHMNSQKVSN